MNKKKSGVRKIRKECALQFKKAEIIKEIEDYALKTAILNGNRLQFHNFFLVVK